MKLLISVFILIFSMGTYASGGVGNGGDVIVCPTYVQLLDSYEAQKMRLKINLNNPKVEEQTWRSMVNTAVKRLNRFDKYTASKLYDYAMEMVNDFEKFQSMPEARGKSVYLGHDVLAEVNDSLHVSVPEACEPKTRQLVIQKVPKFRFEYRYEVSKTYWDKMTLLEQSMTILHEAWYRIMLESGATDSKATRYINALVASEEFNDFTFVDYFKEIKNTELKTYIVGNISDVLKNKTIKFSLKKHMFSEKDGAVCAPEFILSPNIKESYTVINRKQKYVKKMKFKNVCFKNSKLTTLEFNPNYMDSKYTLRLPFNQIVFEGTIGSRPAIHFHENGMLSHFSDIKFKELVRMFYVYGKNKSFVNHKSSTSGPYTDHKTKIANPLDIRFDKNEKILSHF